MKPFKGTTSTPWTPAHFTRWPAYVQPKYDGIRCMTIDGVATSASMKPLPNGYLQQHAKLWPNLLDGEIVSTHGFLDAQSFCMTVDKLPHSGISYVVFDCFYDAPFATRFGGISIRMAATKQQLITHTIAPTYDFRTVGELAHAVNSFCTTGEGAIIRSDSPYKCGRSTPRSQELLAVKPYADSEGVIEGFYPLERNLNPQEQNELGLSKRSSAQAGKHTDDLLGGFIVRLPDGTTFHLGGGFTTSQREAFWHARESTIGHSVTFKHQVFGAKDKPRQPIFKAIRHPLDTTLPDGV